MTKTEKTQYSDRTEILWNGRLYAIWVNGEMKAYCFEKEDAMRYAARYDRYAREAQEEER